MVAFYAGIRCKEKHRMVAFYSIYDGCILCRHKMQGSDGKV
jgi:hypothetical protein